jgi:uncharacterized heparinase superfamily protein
MCDEPTRAQRYEQLASFDGKALDDAIFERRALGLLKAPLASADDLYEAFVAGPRPGSGVAAGGVRAQTAQKGDEETAEALLGNVFNFYGEVHDLGADIDWDTNPGTAHWGHDLNRFSFLAPLVRAWQQTGDEKYARKAADLILDWIAKTDVADARGGCGRPDEVSKYVWTSYLNIAVHLAAWTDHLPALAPFMTPLELLRVLKSIHEQLHWLMRVIPNASNNWVVIGAWGVIFAAARLPELRDRELFLDFAWQRMVEEAPREVLPDGVQFELTPGYHYVVAGRMLDCARVCRAAGLDVPAAIDSAVAAMLDYQIQTILPTGNLLAFNDTDPEASAAILEGLATAGRAFDRPDWLFVGTRGAEGAAPAITNQAFDYGGVYIMRSGWGPDDSYLAFDGGPWGRSHQHDDRLSFQLTALGRDMIIDPGRYLYDWDNPFSFDAYLRLTRAHSTISVDGLTQADRRFRRDWVSWQPLGEQGNRWVQLDGLCLASSTHRLGYIEPEAPARDRHADAEPTAAEVRVVHHRAVAGWAGRVFLVLDELTGDGEHDIHSRLQLAPGELTHNDGLWHTNWPDANLAIIPWMSQPFEVSIVSGQLDPTQGWYSRMVNAIEPSPSFTVHARSAMPLRGAFLLVPYKGIKPPSMSLEVSDSAAVATVDGERFELAWAQAFEPGEVS